MEQMNVRVGLFIIVVVVGVLWFWLIYPSYLSVIECVDASQADIERVIAERNKKVFEPKDDMCMVERDILTAIDTCFQTKRDESFINTMMLWYPPITLNYQKLAKQHALQCLDDVSGYSPSLWK